MPLVVNAFNSKPDPTFQNLVIEVVFCNYSVICTCITNNIVFNTTVNQTFILNTKLTKWSCVNSSTTPFFENLEKSCIVGEF